MLKITLIKTLGGYANLTFLAEINGEKYVIKFLKFNLTKFTNNGMETYFRKILNESENSINFPDFVWKCKNFLIEKFVENTVIFDIDTHLKTDEVPGMWRNNIIIS